MTVESTPAEVEVKLEAGADQLGQIAQLRELGPYRLRPRRAQRLHTVYLDTKNLALARAGVALRLRHAGRSWEVSAKWGGRVVGSLHERSELTVVLPGEPAVPFKLPEGPLRIQLMAVVLNRPLVPIFSSEVLRQLRDLVPVRPLAAGAAPLAEVALDTVSLHRPNGEEAGVSYCEIEIERRAGRTRDITAFGRALQERFGITPSRGSKFARGLAEMYGAAVAGFQVGSVEAHDSLCAAARKVVAAQLARLRAADPGTRLGLDPEAVHEERVAVRRLRAALRAFAAGFPPQLLERLRVELRWLGSMLGAVRDLDVQLANLAWHAHRLGQAAGGLDTFRHHLENERTERRAELLAAFDTPRYFRLLAALERFATGPAPRHPHGEGARPVAAVGRRAAKRALRRLIRDGDAMGELPEAEELHALRIRAKRVRYLFEALKPISGTPGRRLIKQLARLQDVLGRFNDSMVAASFVRAYRDGPGASADEAVRRVLSAMADVELRRAGAAQAEFARAWRRFTGKATLRQRDELLEELKNALRCAHDAATASAPTPEVEQ